MLGTHADGILISCWFDFRLPTEWPPAQHALLRLFDQSNHLLRPATRSPIRNLHSRSNKSQGKAAPCPCMLPSQQLIRNLGQKLGSGGELSDQDVVQYLEALDAAQPGPVRGEALQQEAWRDQLRGPRDPLKGRGKTVHRRLMTPLLCLACAGLHFPPPPFRAHRLGRPAWQPSGIVSD